MTLYPLLFHPTFKERVWGGRTLQSLYGKALPPDVPIGESWEVSDRPGDESVIGNGPLAGRTIRWLMDNHRDAVLGGSAAADANRFPLLCKILDAREKLSLQVHPPPSVDHLGDPKTEMWYVARADEGAELYVGLKRGVTRAQFEEELRAGTVANCFHRIPVRGGDVMFLPSGRVHAIGAGLVIFEIQQNSDTTFRVFDWNRLGLDGAPRALHIAESLSSIDFGDFEPTLVDDREQLSGDFAMRLLVNHDLFDARLIRAARRAAMMLPARLQVLALVEGIATVSGNGVSATMAPGQFCVVPAAVTDAAIAAEPGARILVAEPK